MSVAGEKHCNELARVWAGTGRQEVLGGRMQAPGSSDHAASWHKEATSKRSTRVHKNDPRSGITSIWLARGRQEVLEGGRKPRRYARIHAMYFGVVAGLEK